MVKVFALVVAAAFVSSDGTRAAITGAVTDDSRSSPAPAAVVESGIAELIGSARGAPPMMCALASRAVRGFGNWLEAPVSPIQVDKEKLYTDRAELTREDTDLLVQSLSSDDACVRELAVRIVARRGDESVTREFISRLSGPTESVREVAALGLGIQEPVAAVDPLIRALRDEGSGVRANSAWALGMIENGKALSPLLGLVGDRAEIVRVAAVHAVGRLDSTRSVSSLIRVLRDDDSPRVRRAAAWALGELEAREGIEALSGALTRDADPRVREMSAWALGSIEDRAANPALLGAAQRDADDKVRETAVWALAEIEDESTADALASIAGSDRNARVRGTAAWAIGNMREGSGRAPAALVRLLKDESEDTRLKAAWALSEIGDSTAVGPVNDALKTEKSERVNRALIRALVVSGRRSVATLTELLDSRDPEVREAAVRALAGRSSRDPWPWPQPRPRPNP